MDGLLNQSCRISDNIRFKCFIRFHLNNTSVSGHICFSYAVYRHHVLPMMTAAMLGHKAPFLSMLYTILSLKTMTILDKHIMCQ